MVVREAIRSLVSWDLGRLQEESGVICVRPSERGVWRMCAWRSEHGKIKNQEQAKMFFMFALLFGQYRHRLHGCTAHLWAPYGFTTPCRDCSV